MQHRLYHLGAAVLCLAANKAWAAVRSVEAKSLNPSLSRDPSIK